MYQVHSSNRFILILLMQSDSSDDSQGSSSDSQDIYIDEACTLTTVIQYIDPKELNKFPHNAIGAITFRHHTIQGRIVANGTGFLVTPNLVLTVAHCVFDKILKKKYLDIQFYPSLYGRLANPIKVIDYRIPEQFRNLQRDIIERRGGVKYDYALLKLEKEVQLPQYFKIVNKFNNDLEKIRTFGYPGFMIEQNEAVGKQAGCQGQQFTSIIKIDSKTMRLKHCLSSISGQSGSPILLENNEVVAIHKSGIRNKSFNCGVLINNQLLVNVKQWQEQLNKQKKMKIQIKEYPRQRSLSHSRLLVQTSKQRPDLTHIKKIGEVNYKNFPFSCIGQIFVGLQGQKDKGGANTAFLISDNLILTCFSSIYDPNIQNFGANTPGLELHFAASFMKNKKIPVQSYMFNKESLELQRQKHKLLMKGSEMLEDIFFDFCLLKLAQKIHLPSYLELLISFDNDESQFELYGCPCRDNYDNPIQKVNIFGTKCNGINIYIDKHMISHSLDTKLGMVGSPLIVLENKVIGIHKLRLKKQMNCKGARLVTIDMVGKLYQWNKQLNGTPFVVNYYMEDIIEVKNTKQLQKHHKNKKHSIRSSRVDKK